MILNIRLIIGVLCIAWLLYIAYVSYQEWNAPEENKQSEQNCHYNGQTESERSSRLIKYYICTTPG